jgi:hypothetical protein
MHQCEMTRNYVCTAGRFCFTRLACSVHALAVSCVVSLQKCEHKQTSMRIAVKQTLSCDRAVDTWQSPAASYLAIRQVSVARDITELLIAKLADAALQLETCEGACHTPEPDVPCACSKRIRGISLNYGMRPCKTQQSRLCKELVCLRLAVHRQEHQKDAVVLRQHLKRT